MPRPLPWIRPLRLCLVVGVTALAALPVPADSVSWRFEGLERLYFERLEDPGVAHDEVSYPAELRRLLPPVLAAGESMTVEPWVVTDLDGPIHDGLEVRDLPLPPDFEPGRTVFLRQVVDGTHPRLKEQYWALYSGAVRTDLWFFSTFPSRRSDSKLLAPFLIERLTSHQDGSFTVRARGSVSRPGGAGWQHGVDLVFAVADRELRYRYAVRRYSFTIGYARDGVHSWHVGVEEAREEDGRTVLVRQIFDDILPPQLSESCGIDPLYDVPMGDFERMVEIAACIAASSGSVTLRRGPDEPSFIERGGKAE